MTDEFLSSGLAQAIVALRLPRHNELPSLGLYLDQVLFVVDDALRPLFPTSDKTILTATMVNNYVKQKVVAPPMKKRYSRDHVAYFLAVALLKQAFSLAEIAALFQWQKSQCSVEKAYNLLCMELETALHAAFSTRAVPAGEVCGSDDSELLRSLVMCLVNKTYVEKYFEFQALRAVPAAAETEKGEKTECS